MNELAIINFSEERGKSLLFKRYLRDQEKILIDEFCGHEIDIAA